MTKSGPDQVSAEDSQAFIENFSKINERSQKIVQAFLAKQENLDFNPDPYNIGSAFMELTATWLSDPAKAAEAQGKLWQSYMDLWQNTAARMSGQDVNPVISPARGDKRFKDKDWQDNQIFDYMKQSYLLTADWIQKSVADTEGIDEKTRAKLNFFTKLYVEALSPTNFAWSNPEVIRKTVDSKGENLVRGLENLLEDMKSSKGLPTPKMTDESAFEVGKNIAATPGKVIYQNDMMQLIQFTPTTEKTYKKPLLITPPWINKYYILDLRQDNSFIKWSLDRGYTVFVISWVNPTEAHKDKTFESYMSEGILAALDAIEQATGETEVNAIGYCIGGTLMSATLAYLAAVGEERISSCTFFAAQVDFTEAGELMVFVDDEQIEMIEKRMQKEGFFGGQDMSSTFNMLRSSDLIWSFVINNYLLGKEPFPFDLLYWNSDTTNMPPKMHRFYLENMYQKNLLQKPGGLTLGGQSIDLRNIKIPVFVQASKEDHISPYNSVFKITKLFSGPAEFMLAGSGHIAGVINHPDAGKYQHWTNSKRKKYDSGDDWLKDAEEHPGSWWPHWDKWLSKKSGPKVKARTPGDGKLKVIEDAPGSYVQKKSG